MRTRFYWLIALIAILALALPLSGATSAQQVRGTSALNGRAFNRVKIDPELTLVKQPRGAAAAQRGIVSVIIELADAPTAAVYANAVARGTVARATTDAQQQLGRIQRAQDAVLRVLQDPSMNARVLSRTQRVYNGIAAKIDASKLDQIARLPEVKAIRANRVIERQNSTSVPFIGAPQLWSGSGASGATGRGISIGIIDTGIDYLHTNFGGSGATGDYDRNDTTTISDGFFPNGKVAGGRDFVGDDYDAGNPDADVPMPDPDPMDCNGHGTHVAGTAAGYGVNADGTTYRGPWNTSTPFSALRIGPGVAPEAELWALRIFGCGGSASDAITAAAIEYAVDPNGDGDFSDRLDVINMSLGLDYGGYTDASSTASDNAAGIGVIVVAAAGNAGDSTYIGGSPAASGRTISVASSVDNGIIFNGIRVNTPPAIAGTYEAALAGFGPPLTATGVTGNVVYPASNSNGCAAFPAGTFAGKIALIDRGACTFVVKVKNAQNAGAIAVIIVNNVAGPPTAPGGDDPTITIPSVMISQADGQKIKTALAGGQTVNVTLASSVTIPRPDLADTLSSFSSRGPRRGDSALKPDIAAPGQTITSSLSGSGNQPLTISGTSMATPHVAGAMALLRQLRPDWTVEELKALAMNTANSPVRSDVPAGSTPYGPQRVGAGRITLPQAATSQVVAYNADDQGFVSVSFGAVEVVGTKTATKTVRVVNKGASSVTYTLSYQGASDVPGVSFTAAPSSVTVPAGGAANVVVTMTATAAAMRHSADPTLSETQGGAPRHWLSEESGIVLMTPASGTTLRVPVYAAARPASDMRAATSSLNFGTSATAAGTIDLTGQEVNTGDEFPTDEVSIASAYELQVSSPNDLNTSGITNNADLKYVGAASNAKSAPFADAGVSFGIATQGEWSTPNEVEFDIYIDTNRDGKDDYVLFNTNLGSATGGDPNDVFVTYLLNLNDDTAEPALYSLNGFDASVINTVPFNTNVMLMPVALSDLGLTAANATFNYRVKTFSIDYQEFGAVADTSPTVTYNALNPGLNFTGGVDGTNAYLDLNATNITFNYTLTGYKSNRSQGVLLLHHHNAKGNRAEVVKIAADFPIKLYLPTIGQGAMLGAQLAGTNEVPPVQTSASGRATLSYNGTTRKLSYTLEVFNIENVTMAHIHRGAKGTNGPIIYPLLKPGQTLAPGSPVSGEITINPVDEAALFNGGLYVNVHTTKNPTGEVRGQIESR